MHAKEPESSRLREPRRRFLSTLGGMTAALALPALAQQPFPQRGRPVRVLVGFAPGGTTDIMARDIAPKLGDVLGVPVLVENRPGGNGVIAGSAVAHAAPDGYTLFFTLWSSFSQIPHTMKVQPYDVFKDFTPISMASQGPSVLVAWNGLPVRNVRELVAYAKAHPGEVSISSSGTGTSSHIYAEILMREAGIKLLHVPYKGAGDASRDLFAGTVQLTFTGAPTAVQFQASGRVKMLGVTAAKRSTVLPDVPTFSEAGIAGLDLAGWQGYFGPPNMAPAVVEALNQAIAKALADPGVKEKIARSLWEVAPSTPAALSKLIERDYQRWGSMMKELGIEPQ